MYKIVKAECLADKIYLMDVEAPRIAKLCQPGEFLIVKMDQVGERIPLTICDYDREKGLVTHRIPDRRRVHRKDGGTESRRLFPGCGRSFGTALRVCKRGY